MRTTRGFTLLELLIVMAVILIIIGLAVVRLDDSGRRVTQANAEQLSLTLEAARDLAVYSGKPVAFSSDGVGFQFWRNDEKQRKWVALTDEKALSPRSLQNEVQLLEQTVNNKPQALGERVIFAADGLSEPFSLTLQGGNARVRVSADALGRISIEPVPLESTDAR
jgi:general secretion pathway protein H